MEPDARATPRKNVSRISSRSPVEPEKNEVVAKPAKAKESVWLEKDVSRNFLVEGHFYRGFFYLMRNTDIEPAAQLRSTLFPTLTLSLEAVLHQLVNEQLENEIMQLKKYGSGSFSGDASPKTWRQTPTFPSQPIKSSTHPIVLLATELKRRSKREVSKVEAQKSDSQFVEE